MSRQQPGSVTNAVRLLVGLVALSGLTAVLTIVFRDELIRVWANGQRDTGSVKPLDFVPVVIVLFVVFAALAGVLVMFIRDGHNWARLSLSALVVFTAVGSLAGLRTSPPTLFVVLSALSIVLGLLLLVFLWHRDTNAYIRGAWLASRPDSSASPDSPASSARN